MAVERRHRLQHRNGVIYKASALYICLMLTVIAFLLAWGLGVFG
jgi:hypothetical protein